MLAGKLLPGTDGYSASETLVTIHHLTWYNIPEDLNLQTVTWFGLSS
jgi:hypothetical protein